VTFFEIDPFALLASPFIDLLPMIADPERFESVERRIEEGMGAAFRDRRSAGGDEGLG
jgi:hypothetical protein